MSDITPETFEQLKNAALKKAQELREHSCTMWCPRCQRPTLHYLTMRLNDQQIYKCFGCGQSDAYQVKA